MAATSPEEQIFFVYDRNILQAEDDDLKDAIVYFFPTTTNIQRQCSYCGQLMGLVVFFEDFAGSPPAVYTLAKNKFAVKHLGKFSLALAGSHADPNSVILNQLEYLSNLLTFYQHSLGRIEDESESKGELLSRMTRTWDCYWPFVRRYGDNMAAAFEALPTVDLPTSCGSVFLRASHLLQQCQRNTTILAGCIIFKSRILLSQFRSSITKKLLIIKPHQSNLPCKKITVDYEHPQNVRFLSVYLSPEEYLQLVPNAILVYEGQEPQAPETHLKQSEVLKILREVSSECDVHENNQEPEEEEAAVAHDGLRKSTECETSAELKDELGQAMESLQSPDDEDDSAQHTLSNTSNVPADSDLVENVVEGGVLNTGYSEQCDGTRNKTQVDNMIDSTSGRMASISSLNDNVFVEAKQTENPKAKSVIPNELNCDNKVIPNSVLDSVKQKTGVEKPSPQSTALGSTDESVSNACTSDSSEIRSCSSTDRCSLTSAGFSAREKEPKSRKQMSFEASDLLNSVKIAAAKGTQAINQRGSYAGLADMNGGAGDIHFLKRSSSSKSSSHAGDFNIDSNPHHSNSAEVVGHVVNESLSIHSAISLNKQTSTDDSNEQRRQNCFVNSNSRLHHNSDTAECTGSGDHASHPDGKSEPNLFGNNRPSSQSLDDRLYRMPTEHLHAGDPSAVNSPTSPVISSSSPGERKTAVVDKSGLVELDLYIQGHGDLVIIQLMDKGSAQNHQAMRKMWKSIVIELGDLEPRLKGSYKIKQQENNQSSQSQLSYNYLTFDPFARSLEGRIALSGSDLKPMTSNENHFCETSVKLHEDFQKRPSLSDVTLRHSSGSVFGKNNPVMEVFFQSCDPNPSPGAPNEKDPALNLEERSSRKLLRDQGLFLL